MARRRPLPDDVRIDAFDNQRPVNLTLPSLLRRLMTLPTGATILSLYLDLRFDDEQQRERDRLIVHDRVRALGAGADGPLAEDLAAVLEFTEDRIRQWADVGYGGAACFCSTALGLDLSLRTPSRLPTLLGAGPVALLRPLVAAAHGHERALVAIAASDEVRVYEMALGGIRLATAHASDVPQHHDRGGWSQLKLQHHRQERISSLHREAAESLARLFDGAPTRVLIGGPSEVVASLERQLPTRVAECALRLPALSKYDPPHQVHAAATRALDDAERSDERETLARIQTLACSGGRGALGIHDVVDALNGARPMRVFVPDESARRLFLCESCHFLARDAVERCPMCGGPAVELDASEALVRAALALGARIDMVEHALLDAVGGAAAELRF